jgi:hypothetical protein
METALRRPDMAEEIRRLAARTSPRESPGRWAAGNADSLAWRLDAAGHDKAAEALWRALEKTGMRP